MSRVVARRDRGRGKPGIVTVQTLAQNQDAQVVCQYRRKIFVPRRGDGPIDPGALAPAQTDFPYDDAPVLHVPRPGGGSPPIPRGLTSDATRLAAFEPGRIFVHKNARTITDEHIAWTYGVMNTHPLHYDRLYSTSRDGAMSGEPIVYGGLIFGWLLGLASRDTTENAIWELGYHDGYHTQPTFGGDTIAALSRVLSVVPVVIDGDRGAEADAGIVRIQLIGVKNIHAEDALGRFGADLFIRENDKRKVGKDKLPEKIFEIEREVLIAR